MRRCYCELKQSEKPFWRWQWCPYLDIEEVLFRKTNGKQGLDERWMRTKHLTLLHLEQLSQNVRNLHTLAPSDFHWSPLVDSCQWWLLWSGREVPTGQKWSERCGQWGTWRWWEVRPGAHRQALLIIIFRGGGAPLMCSVTTRPLRPGPMNSGMAQKDQSPRAMISMEGLSYNQLQTGGCRPMLALPHLHWSIRAVFPKLLAQPVRKAGPREKPGCVSALSLSLSQLASPGINA